MSRRQHRERHSRRKRHGEQRGWRTRQSLITGATVTAGALVGFSSTATAADFQVTNTNDSTVGDANCLAGNCTLRQAVTAANNGGDAIDNITFQSGLSGQIDLTNGQIMVTGGTYFLGPGANALRISGNSSSRIFDIDPTVSGRPVGIYDLSLVYGHTTGKGGAVYNLDGILKVARCVISENTADLSGGGIANQGVYNYGYGSYIVDSTITGNSAVQAGGGVYGFNSAGTIENSTISENHQTDGSSVYGGGGVFSYYYTTTIDDSTIAGNTAARRGGGVLAILPGATGHPDELNNTIVANNSDVIGNPDIGGSFRAGFSLIENPSGATLNSTVAGSNITGLDPQLGILTENGGPTPTQVPAVTSPAIDQGKRALRGTDQRGRARPFDVPTIPNSAAAGADGSDIGAVELQASELPSNAFSVRVKGKTLVVSVASAGGVKVSDAKAPLSVGAAKKKRKLLLNSSSGTGGPPSISVKLRLTKLAKKKLRQKGKVTVKARITFTPNRGIPKTVTQKLKIRAKK
jgi:hypothetical protein